MQMQAENNVSQKIQIFISARSLKDLDFFSKSDPYVKISFRRDFNAKSYIPIGRTQTKSNNLNPNFEKSFIIDYIFESRQDIKFQVMDDDNGNDDFLGSVQTTVGFLMGAKSQTSLHDIKIQGKNSGKLIIRCEKVSDTNEYYAMKWKAEKLMNTDSFFDFWDKSDPYLKFLKIREDNTFIQAERTQVIHNNLSPSWAPIQISAGRLHTPNNPRFKIQCWDWQEGEHQFIGQCFLDIRQIIQNNSFPLQFPLVNPKKSNPGKIVLQSLRIVKRPSFIDYLRGGLELNMVVAIDFTGSNGSPQISSSLHYMDPKSPNQYQVAIQAISSIMLNYDSDKRIPSFGFGAKPRYPNGINSNMVSHCFPLSGKPNQVQTFGYQHLMTTYMNALKSLEFSGPTLFRPIIEQAMKVASLAKSQGSNTYQVLLILTDGQIHDMPQTVELLVQNCNLPISIIIVGIGNADFANMNQLDGDGGLYAENGQKSQRDIVQFVPFREVKINPDLLAKELLAELPGQVVQYMTLIGKPPNKPLQADISQMINNSPNNSNPMQNNQLLGLINHPTLLAPDNPQQQSPNQQHPQQHSPNQQHPPNQQQNMPNQSNQSNQQQNPPNQANQIKNPYGLD